MQSPSNRTAMSVDDDSMIRQVLCLTLREEVLTVVGDAADGDAGLGHHKAIGTSPSDARSIPTRSKQNG